MTTNLIHQDGHLIYVKNIYNLWVNTICIATTAGGKTLTPIEDLTRFVAWPTPGSSDLASSSLSLKTSWASPLLVGLVFPRFVFN